MKLAFWVALGVAGGIFLFMALLWLASLALAWIAPGVTGRAYLRKAIAQRGVPPAAFERRTISAAASLAWDIAAGSPRRARFESYTGVLEDYADALIASLGGFAQGTTAEPYRMIVDAINKRAMR